MAATASRGSARQPCASGTQGADAACRLARAEAARRERPRDARPRSRAACASAGTDARVLRPRERVGHRPPRDARLTRLVEHDPEQARRAAFRRVSAYTPRRNASAAGSIGLDPSSASSDAAATAGRCAAAIAAMACAEPASPMRPSASAARPCTSGDGSCSAARRGSTADAVADEAQREGRHLPHFGVAVAGQHRGQRRHAVGQPHAADGQRRAAAHAALRVLQQPDEVRRRRRRGRRLPAAAALRGRCRGRGDGGRRRGRAEDALVLELKDPRHLLLEGQRRRRRRRWAAARPGPRPATRAGRPALAARVITA